MLAVAQIKNILKDEQISNSEAEKIRDDLRMLAEIIFEQWQTEKREIHKIGLGKNIRKPHNASVDP